MFNVIKNQLSLSLLVIVVFSLGIFVGQSNTIVSAVDDFDQSFESISDVFHLILHRHINTDIGVNDLVEGAINGMIETLGDPHSQYMNPEMLEDWQNRLDGNIEGIGVVIDLDEDTGIISVISVIESSPAENVGVQPGDIFYEVDGYLVNGMSIKELGDLVRGRAGSSVVIVFRRSGDLITLSIVRAHIEIPNVEYELLPENILYISMGSFNNSSRIEMNKAFQDFDVNSTNGLIFDLRGNPGGLVSAAVDIASIFIEDDIILYEIYNKGQEDILRSNGNNIDIGVPIVVLIDERSASASELVAGALQDYEIATLIGKTTFGKGTVQTIIPVSNGGALRLTIARYLLPSRRWIHEYGVQPDIVIDYDEILDAGDIQLQVSIDYILDMNK